MHQTSNVIICDIDGTIADCSHRLHILNLSQSEAMTSAQRSKLDWDGFHAAADKDGVYENVVSILRMARTSGCSIFLMTGRAERNRKITQTWLRNKGINYDRLIMRPDGDFRRDTIVKRELYELYVAPRKVLFCLEDRDGVVEMWRELGLTCLQVRKGDY